MRLLVTGGAGFIGSAVVRLAVDRGFDVVALDALTYCGNLENLAPVEHARGYSFARADLLDPVAIESILARHQPDAVLHLAAETHVDRSIEGPLAFVRTNVLGTANLLECLRTYWATLSAERQDRFRLINISTDEVFGQLGLEGRFNETSAYAPNSPYSASKAGADHLVRAWGHTFGLPVIVTHGCNNYGPYQYPEKLVPVVILAALEGRPIPIYGHGDNVRDWLYVEDHAEALLRVVEWGRLGETYCIGGEAETSNLSLAERICDQLDLAQPRAGLRRRDLIMFVADRAGHDFRYAVDPSKMRTDLAWRARTPLDAGLAKTVKWYLDNPAWVAGVRERGADEQAVEGAQHSIAAGRP
jgi:dTDP-glucose 4,6-dehydratase